MDNEKKNLKKKKTTRKSINKHNSRTDLQQGLKSNSLPVMRRYLKLFREFAMDPDNVVAGMFFMKYDVPKTAFFDMLKKYPEVHEEYYDLIEIIGAKREDGALRNKLNSSFVLTTHAMYSKAYKEMKESYMKLKAELNKDNGATHITVYQEKYPSTDEVPAIGTKNNSSQ